jgi:2-polyprenyl-3-methyl-5-hydroxy-6-metoxy-1,4-benzoquinol methylase
VSSRIESAQVWLDEVQHLKYGPEATRGWTPLLREKFGYISPADLYEATLFGLIRTETEWLDVGCGRNVFPTNPDAARRLSRTCRLLVGIDPSENVHDNEFVHERVQCELQDYQAGHQFDLVTMRMVAEHIEKPPTALAALSRLVRPGGRVVILTVGRFSLPSLVAAATPMWTHHIVKRALWGSEERDTFPVAYRMNTRRTLRRLFEAAGFREESFLDLDDCGHFDRFRRLAAAELALWRGFKALRLPWPDRCLLGVYQRTDVPAAAARGAAIAAGAK